MIKGMIANTILTFEVDKILSTTSNKKINQLRDSNELSEDDYVLLSSSHITDSILEEKTLGNYHNIDSKLPLEIRGNTNKANEKLQMKK